MLYNLYAVNPINPLVAATPPTALDENAKSDLAPMLTQPNPLDEVQPADLAHMIRRPQYPLQRSRCTSAAVPLRGTRL